VQLEHYSSKLRTMNNELRMWYSYLKKKMTYFLGKTVKFTCPFWAGGSACLFNYLYYGA